MTKSQTTKRSHLLDRLAGFVGAWAIRRLYDPQCEEYHEGCCDCEAEKIMKIMEGIAHGR